MTDWPDCPYPKCKREAVYTNGNADAITCKQHSWCPAEMLEMTDAHVLKMGKNIIAKARPGQQASECCDLCTSYTTYWVSIGSGRDRRVICSRCSDEISAAW